MLGLIDTSAATADARRFSASVVAMTENPKDGAVMVGCVGVLTVLDCV